MNNALFLSLPVSTQSEVKSILSAYNDCSIEKTKSGEYKVIICVAIHCGEYNEQLGSINKNDIFTADEQIINYVKSFRDYPIQYKGKKDYILLQGDWTNAVMIDGNVIIN